MNLIFICTALKRMYNMVIRELLYDSELEKVVHDHSSTIPSDDSEFISSADFMRVWL